MCLAYVGASGCDTLCEHTESMKSASLVAEFTVVATACSDVLLCIAILCGADTMRAAK